MNLKECKHCEHIRTLCVILTVIIQITTLLIVAGILVI